MIPTFIQAQKNINHPNVFPQYHQQPQPQAQPQFCPQSHSHSHSKYPDFSPTAFTWQQFTGRLPHDAVFASDNYVVIRAYYNNDWMTGKLNLKDMRAYVPYDYKEVYVTNNIEVLVAAPGHIVEWVPASQGQVPQGAVGPIGKDNVFVGRAVCPHPESVYTPGKIHPSHGSLYMPFGGKEVPSQMYEACVIRPGHNGHSSHNSHNSHNNHSSNTSGSDGQWQRFTGRVPSQAVLASNQYAVIRVQHAGQWVPGKLSTRTLKAYAAYDMKEVEVNHNNVEILVQTPGMEARWVPAYNGAVPQGAVGPFGADGVYIGRAVCPRPENVHTPGKIHPSHQCLYMPFDGKEINYKQYEALVMVPMKNNWKANLIQGFIGFQPR